MTTPRLSHFSELEVVVVGDLIVDHYLYAEPRRLSREAPVMVLRHVHDRVGAGGAANVARNARALGCRVRVLGVVGADESGRLLLELLAAESIDTSGVRTLADFRTPTKTRVLAAEPRRSLQQVLRIDRDPQRPIAPEVKAAIAAELDATADSIDALVVSDYGYGIAAEEVGLAATRLCAAGKTAVLDPLREVRRFAGLTALTPNVSELASCTGTPLDDLDDRDALAAAAAALLRKAACRFLLVTRGNLGMALFGEGLPSDGAVVEASGTRDVTDVCGAGDTAAAVFAAALAAGCAAARAMVLANAAAGVVVLEHGAAVCRVEALEAAVLEAPASASSADAAGC